MLRIASALSLILVASVAWGVTQLGYPNVDLGGKVWKSYPAKGSASAKVDDVPGSGDADYIFSTTPTTTQVLGIAKPAMGGAFASAPVTVTIRAGSIGASTTLEYIVKTTNNVVLASGTVGVTSTPSNVIALNGTLVRAEDLPLKVLVATTSCAPCTLAVYSIEAQYANIVTRALIVS